MVCAAACLGSSGSTWAQQWARTYGGGGSHAAARAVQQTSDGGYIVVGNTPVGLSVSGWIMKLDRFGAIEWEKNLQIYSDTRLHAVDETLDGGFIVAGLVRFPPNTARRMSLVMRLTCTGDEVWRWSHFRSGFNAAHSVRHTSDGGFIVAGNTAQAPNLSTRGWVLKLDASGNAVWYVGLNYSSAYRSDAPYSVREVAGGYIIAGEGFSTAGGFDLTLTKLDTQGKFLWHKTYGGAGSELGGTASVKEVSSGGFILAGRTESFGAGSGDAWLLRLDAAGAIIWEAAYGGAGNDWAHDVVEVPGGFVVAGVFAGTEFWGFKIDSLGNLQWQKAYAPLEALSVDLTLDGGLVFAGGGPTASPSYIVKTDALGEVQTSSCVFTPTTALATSTFATVRSPGTWGHESSNLIRSFAGGPLNTSVQQTTVCSRAGTYPITRNLCGSLTGTNWISLPTCSPLQTAEDLCASIGASALTVSQWFPDGTGRWTWDCVSQVCQGSPIPEYPGCGSACFCIDDGEGYEVTVSQSGTYTIDGSDSPVPITLPSGGHAYLVSIPGDTSLATAGDLLTNPVPALSVARHDCQTNTLDVWNGTAGANFALQPGEAYLVTYPTSTGATFTNPTNSTATCPRQPCPVISGTGKYCISGNSTGQPYAWWVDLNTNALIDGTEPSDPSATPVATGAGAGALANAFAVSINAQTRFPDFVSASVSGNCFTLSSARGTPELWVGPQNFPQTCKVLTSGCSYNPTIVKVDGTCASDAACADTDACTTDLCDTFTGLCLNIPLTDEDSDTVCDAQDNCPVDPDPSQQDADGDDVGDVCDNCPGPPGANVFGQDIAATDPVTFSWAFPTDVDILEGDLATLGTYEFMSYRTVLNATSFTDQSDPPIGGGLYYLVRSACGSWQTSSGAESARDSMLP